MGIECLFPALYMYLQTHQCYFIILRDYCHFIYFYIFMGGMDFHVMDSCQNTLIQYLPSSSRIVIKQSTRSNNGTLQLWMYKASVKLL